MRLVNHSQQLPLLRVSLPDNAGRLNALGQKGQSCMVKYMLCVAETSAIDVTHPSLPVQGAGASVGVAEGVAVLKQLLKDLLVN